MILTIASTHAPASELSYLLHKHPDRFQTFDLSYGQAHVFYTEVGEDRCEACLLLDVDPVGMVRGRNADQAFPLAQYVNDRPYVASSLMSSAISDVFGSAMNGRCQDRPELAKTAIALEARLDVLPVRGGERWLSAVFEPLGYVVEANRLTLDPMFPEWGESPYFTVTLRKTTTLSELLMHLYVLIPVFDNNKHYYVGKDELEKLLAKGKGWLSTHPLKDWISRRYLKFQASLYREALERLTEDDPDLNPDLEPALEGEPQTEAQVRLERENRLESDLSLHQQRLQIVFDAVKATGAKSVLDLGCGEGKLLRILFKDRQFERIVGLDVSMRSLEIAKARLRLESLSTAKAKRIDLWHGALTYRDPRFSGFDAAVLVEVIEHLEPNRLEALERVVFEFAKPGVVIVTTPNREYNSVWESLPAGQFRHPDHRFEWTRAEFQAWADDVVSRFDYDVRIEPVGPVDEMRGAPTQMAVFTRKESEASS